MPLYSQLEANHFKPLETITAAQIDELALQQSSRRKQIEDDILRGAATGYGIVTVGAKVDAICMVIPSEEKGHRQVLLNNIERLTPEFGTMSPVPVMNQSLKDAYKSLQRRDCQAIYASSVDLKNLITALKKADANYSVSSVWATDEDVQRAQKSVEDRELAIAKEEQDRRTKDEAIKKLRDSIEKAERETSRIKQLTLQSENGKIAAARSAEIANVVREATDSRPDWQQTTAFDQFPQFTTWFQNLVKNRWELQSFNSEIFDYGIGLWKGRRMETAFAKVTIRIRNRILGEYQDACFLFGRMNDSEFDMVRDTIEVTCGKEAELSSWKQTHGFESRWLVGPAGS